MQKESLKASFTSFVYSGVPPLLVTLVFGGKTRVEKAILHAVDMPEKSGENGNDNLKRP